MARRPAKALIRSGFTMVELMVVILIVLLVSAVVLPTVLPALAHRQVTEAGRILQAGLVQARARAVGANAPRGIRLLPDPTYPAPDAIHTILAYNRWVPIEPGPDYASGQVVIWPVPINNPNNINGDQSLGANALPFNGSAPPYPNPSGGVYPYQPTFIQSGFNGQVLMVEQAPFMNNNPDATAGGGVNNPTSWFWNVRVGDSIQIGNEGRKYTIVGPLTRNPRTTGDNPELFVNDGPPGSTPMLQRTYSFIDSSNNLQPGPTVNVEYLFVVNSQDDDSDGWIDSGWNGVDDSTSVNGSNAAAVGFEFNGNVDDLPEWEIEQWLGNQQVMQAFPQQFVNPNTGPYTPYQAALAITSRNLAPPADYTINRRPVISPGAQETGLPPNVVIDATSWNIQQFFPNLQGMVPERSRLPIDPNSHYVDILLNPSGQAVLQTIYSTPASIGENATFYHFWLSERDDVHELADAWGHDNSTPPTPLPNANYPAFKFVLPIPASYTGSLNTQPKVYLKGERMLVTLFGRTGQVTTNSVEFFDATDVNNPFYDSQLGAREAK